MVEDNDEIVTPEIVRRWVEEVERVQGDDEAAHSEEDLLRYRLLAAVAAGRCGDPAQCAAIALETNKLKFRRWCA